MLHCVRKKKQVWKLYRLCLSMSVYTMSPKPQGFLHSRHVCSAVAGRWSCADWWKDENPPTILLSHNIYCQWKRRMEEVAILSSPSALLYVETRSAGILHLWLHVFGPARGINWHDSRWVWHGLGLLQLIVSVKYWQVSEKTGSQVRKLFYYICTLHIT